MKTALRYALLLTPSVDLLPRRLRRTQASPQAGEKRMRPKRSHPIRSTSSNTSSPSIRPRFRSGRNSANAAAPTIRPEVRDSLLSGWYRRNVVASYDDFFDRYVSEDTTANGSDDATPDSGLRTPAATTRIARPAPLQPPSSAVTSPATPIPATVRSAASWGCRNTISR